MGRFFFCARLPLEGRRLRRRIGALRAPPPARCARYRTGALRVPPYRRAARAARFALRPDRRPPPPPCGAKRRAAAGWRPPWCRNRRSASVVLPAVRPFQSTQTGSCAFSLGGLLVAASGGRCGGAAVVWPSSTNRCLPGNKEPQQPRVAPGESPALRPAKRGARSAPRGAPVGFYRLFRAQRRPEKACCSPPRQPAASPRRSLSGASLRACARAPQPGKICYSIARGASPAEPGAERRFGALRSRAVWGVPRLGVAARAPSSLGRPRNPRPRAAVPPCRCR